VSIVIGGDVLLHEAVVEQARIDAQSHPDGASNGLYFRPALAELKDYVSGADLAFCNLETPLAPLGGPYSGYPQFSVPQDIVPALRDSGFDACTTASNHALDEGYAGLRRSLDALDAAGLKHAGTARTEAEAKTPTILDVRGVKVALLSYGYGLNGIPLPPGKPWAVKLIDIPRMLADAKAARAAGAQIVAVAVHAGDEYVEAPNAQQRAVAAALAASGNVDLVYGHHVHVLQPMDKIGDVWVAYGMGNMLHKQKTMPATTSTYAEALAKFTFTEGPDGRFRVTAAEARPGAMAQPGDRLRYVDLPSLLADPAVGSERRAAYQKLYDRGVKALLALGADAKGLTIVRP
jgi:poly-gamma-glutamate synthesis protein (capsule biosynthesis protein)